MRETFIMCEPAFLDNKVSNNVFMSRGNKPHKIDRKAAIASYHDLVRMLRALNVEILEIPPEEGAQDQSYTANTGIWITPEMGSKTGPQLIVANFSAAGRQIEEEPAMRFFYEMGLSPKQCPYDWEGEADLKYVRPGIFLGGISQFSDPAAYDWIAKLAGVKIHKVKEISKKLYHLDCNFMRIDDNNCLVTPEGLDEKSIQLIQSLYDEEKGQHVWFTPPEFWECGFTNCIICRQTGAIIHEVYEPDIEDKKFETPQQVIAELKKAEKKQAWMTHFARKFGLVEHRLEISEFEYSGADFSCLHMHCSGWRMYSDRVCYKEHLEHI